MKKIISLFLLLFAFSTFSYTQPYVLNIGTIDGSPGEFVLVPVNVTGFNNIAAIGFYIGFDHSVLEFQSLENIHADLSGLIYNDDGTFLRIAWSDQSQNGSGANLGNTKIFDIKFKLLQNNSDICVSTENSIVADNTTLQYVDVTYTCGKVTDMTIGLPQINNDKITSVYPNPSDGLFDIKLNKGEKEVAVYSLDGKQIFDRIVNPSVKDLTTIDLSSYAKGIYVLKLLTDTETSYKKLIIR